MLSTNIGQRAILACTPAGNVLWDCLALIDDATIDLLKDPAVQFWEGDTKPIAPGITLVRLGGHFDGGTVLQWGVGQQ